MKVFARKKILFNVYHRRYTTATLTVHRSSLAEVVDEDSLLDSPHGEDNKPKLGRRRSISNAGSAKSSPRVNSRRGSASAIPLLHTDMITNRPLDSSGELSHSARLAIIKVAASSIISSRRLSDVSNVGLMRRASDVTGAAEPRIRSVATSRRGSGPDKHSSSSPTDTAASSPLDRSRVSVNLKINLKDLSRKNSGQYTSRVHSGNHSNRDNENGISQLQGFSLSSLLVCLSSCSKKAWSKRW